jgi:NAD/NADP transhydrogenase alpha subunit
MSVYGIMALVIAALGGGLVICAKVAAARKKEIKELATAFVAAKEELRRLGKYYAKKEEAERNAEGKKETLHTGDTVVDFDNSLKLLHGAAGGDKGAGPGA